MCHSQTGQTQRDDYRPVTLMLLQKKKKNSIWDDVFSVRGNDSLIWGVCIIQSSICSPAWQTHIKAVKVVPGCSPDQGPPLFLFLLAGISISSLFVKLNLVRERGRLFFSGPRCISSTHLWCKQLWQLHPMTNTHTRRTFYDMMMQCGCVCRALTL